MKFKLTKFKWSHFTTNRSINWILPVFSCFYCWNIEVNRYLLQYVAIHYNTLQCIAFREQWRVGTLINVLFLIFILLNKIFKARESKQHMDSILHINWNLFESFIKIEK